MKIGPLKQPHLEEAAELFAASYRRERKATPILDEGIGTAEIILLKLKSCLDNNPGVAVVENGKLVGYMTGFYIDNFLGVHKGVYSPEWTHASTAGNAFEIYRHLYRELGQQWVRDGCLTHAINCLDHASEAREAFSWNGFGYICIDAVRPVEKIIGELPAGLRITRIQEKDIPVWHSMIDSQARHLAASPSFIPFTELESTDNLLGFLKQPGNHAWMAWLDNEPVGYMRITPIGNGAAWVVNGERKFAINGAYVNPELRGRGIARALLSEIMVWGLKNGFIRCSVDFEATNLEACKFWSGHFQPVCRSLIRRLDETILKNI